MYQIIETYGKAVLLFFAFMMLLLVVLAEIPFGNTKMAFVDAKGPEEKKNQSYEDYLLLKETEIKVIGKIYSGKTIDIEKHLVPEEPLADLRVVDVENKETGKKMPECIISDGQKLYFEKRGMYRITVSTIDEKEVSSKRHFYIFVK